MKITLLVKTEKKEEGLSETVKSTIIPFANSLPEKLKKKAGIYAQTATDFGRKTTVCMTTDLPDGLSPTFLGEDGVFKWRQRESIWGWGWEAISESNSCSQCLDDRTYLKEGRYRHDCDGVMLGDKINFCPSCGLNLNAVKIF